MRCSCGSRWCFGGRRQQERCSDLATTNERLSDPIRNSGLRSVFGRNFQRRFDVKGEFVAVPWLASFVIEGVVVSVEMVESYIGRNGRIFRMVMI